MEKIKNEKIGKKKLLKNVINWKKIEKKRLEKVQKW